VRWRHDAAHWPERLEEILAAVLHRREEWAERQAGHVSELRRRAAEAEAKLKRLYGAIEAASPTSPIRCRRTASELTTIRDQARADAERTETAVERVGASLTPSMLTTVAAEARQRIRTDAGGYRRDHFRALTQRVEVGQAEVRIIGWNTEVLRALRCRRRREIGGVWRSQFYADVARPGGFEPPTHSLEGCCSIHLS